MLLACRQWDPLGLARRLPSLAVGAWRSAPLLPWRVHCPVCVCAALAAGSGGSGRYLVLCFSRFPLPAPRVSRCVWRAVPSGCPLPSLAGTPFNAVCAFRELGPVAPLVVPASFACVCARAPAASASPPPWVVWRAHLARSWHWALVGPFHVVRAPPRVLPRSLVPSGVLPGGGGPVPVPPYLAWGCAPPVGRVRGVRVPEGGFGGGGGGPCAMPPVCAAGGAGRAGGRPASFRPHVFPGQATKRVSLASFWSWGAWSPYHSGSCSSAFSGRDLCGVLARWRGLACSMQFLWEPAAWAGGGPCSGSSLGWGEGGPSPLPRGVGAGAPAACWPVGGVGGGDCAAASLLPRGSLPWPPT